jgi:outer membrane lipoprotein-sorting protein
MRFLRLFVLLVLLSICCSACPRHIGVFIPEGKRIGQPEELLTIIKNQSRQLETMRSAGTIMFRRESKRIKAHIQVVAKQPANMRFETISFFDQPLSILVTNGMDFSLWDMDKGRFLVGSATPANIAQVIPIFMDGPEVVGIFLGRPPLIPYAKVSLDWNATDNVYLLTLSNSSETQEVTIHPKNYYPIKITSKRAGKLFYELTYHGWNKKDDQPAVFKKVRFEMPQKNIIVEVKTSDVEINPQLTDEMFILQPPPGIPIEKIEQ